LSKSRSASAATMCRHSFFASSSRNDGAPRSNPQSALWWLFRLFPQLPPPQLHFLAIYISLNARGRACQGRQPSCSSTGDKNRGRDAYRYAPLPRSASLPQKGSLLRNWNANRTRADPRQQPLPVDLFRFTVKVYVALRRPEGKASGRIQGHIEVVALKIHR